MKYLSLPLAVAGALAGPPLVAQEKLQEVVVIASRVETPLREVGASVSLIDRKEIELRGYPTLAQLLRTQPGISATNTGGAGKQTSLRIRGEEGYRTLILIDGVEVSDPTGTQVMPQVENITTGSEIERIEILRGPQGFIYGADAGGVVQIFTRTAEPGFKGQVGLEGGRYDSQKFNGFVAAGGKQTDAFISVSDWSTDGFNAAVADSSGETDGYDNTTLHGKFGWNLAANTRAQLVLRDISADNFYDACYLTHNCSSEFEQTTAKLSLDHSGEQLSHRLAFAQTDVERHYFSNGQSSFATDGQLKKAEYLGQFAATPSINVVFGGDGEVERVLVEDGEDLSRFQLGMFSEAQFGFDDKLFFTGGLRYDDNQDFGEHVSARITSAYIQPVSTEGALKFRASAGNGFRAPSLQEIAYNNNYGFGIPAETTLKEETSSGYDLGVEYYRESGLSAQLGWFEQSIEDEIVFDLISYSGYFQADGRSHSKGVEFQLIAPVVSWLRLEAGFTRNLTQTAEDLPRIRRPGKILNLSLYFYPVENLVLLLNNRWEQDAVDGANSVPLEDYEVLDMSATYTLITRWEIFARLENALDENYQEVPGYNTSGRAAYLGTRFSF
jgi:vitamin B12 transporter